MASLLLSSPASAPPTAIPCQTTSHQQRMPLHTQLTKSLERILEEANLSGELKLSGRKLKDFPKCGKYDLSDTVIADLSKNKFWELPTEVLEFLFVEKLHLYHNALRSLPESLGCLQSLRFLDLGRNQLSSLPAGICHLQSLEVLLLSNNKLTGLPDDIGNMKSLMDLDASCNELIHLPRSMGRLKNLKALDLRKNLLTELPIELTYLKLTQLDMSENRLSTLPVELRQMSQLERLNLEGNPLVSPPASLVLRGRVHVFKFLETQVSKGERRTLRKTSSSVAELRAKRQAVDSGYSTSDGVDPKWTADEGTLKNKSKTIPFEKDIPVGSLNGSLSTRSDDSMNNSNLSLDQIEAKRLILLQSNDRVPANIFKEKQKNKPYMNGTNGVLPNEKQSNIASDEKRPLEHIQTYREYKEALRLQRSQDIYRPRNASETPTPTTPPDNTIVPKGKSRPNGTASPINGDANGKVYAKPTSPAKTPPGVLGRSPRGVTGKWEGVNGDMSFTLRRDFERAKEEAELIQTLRENIESRLRMTLPNDLGSTLMDGVVLCHLANYVRPRSVGSIHVPSPAVHGPNGEMVQTPKLSMARCRRNVDNFLEACRKIGVEENHICCASDVLEGRGLVQVSITVSELLKFYTPRSPAKVAPTVAN